MEINLGKPNPKQLAFFTARARHICYGGARGGGKSWAMRTKVVMLAGMYPGIKILLLRRTLMELEGNHTIPLLKLLPKEIVKYNDSKKTFTFPNGSLLRLGYCAAEKDVFQYQGHEYDVICLEEATHFSESQMQFLTTCNRTTRTDFTPRMYYTCNPGGIGHQWVKRLFIDCDYTPEENPDDYVFIPATVADNTVLMEADPDYVRALQALPEQLRRAHLEGDWTVFAGQFFSDWRQNLHVVKPFEIPDHWQKYRAIDYGLDMLACIWCAFDELGNAYVYRELCQPETIVSDAARLILGATSERIEATYMPADMAGRSNDTGVSMYETFANAGLYGTLVRNGRVDGWAKLKEWMKPVDDGTGQVRPRMRIFSTCRRLIHDLPLLQYATTGDPSDAAKEPHDITHAPDALRYLCDGRPTPAEVPAAPRDPDEPPELEDEINDIWSYGC